MANRLRDHAHMNNSMSPNPGLVMNHDTACIRRRSPVSVAPEFLKVSHRRGKLTLPEHPVEYTSR